VCHVIAVAAVGGGFRGFRIPGVDCARFVDFALPGVFHALQRLNDSLRGTAIVLTFPDDDAELVGRRTSDLGCIWISRYSGSHPATLSHGTRTKWW